MSSVKTILILPCFLTGCFSCGNLANQPITVRGSNSNRLSSVSELQTESTEWMNGVAFGTSLTYRAKTTGGYLTKLTELCGISFDNQGIGSSTVLGDGDSLDMLASIKKYSNYQEMQVVLLEGFVNDWYQGKQLGNYTDKTEDTVCGCIYTAINCVRTNNVNATLFIILDHFGRRCKVGEIFVDCGSAALNKNNQTQYLYYEQIAKVAESFEKVIVIKGYEVFNISEDTPQFYLDNIHLNKKGADKSAEAIYSIMKDYLL